MSIAISLINNANIYLDGIDFAGQAGEIKLPEIEVEFEEHKTLGMYLSPSLPMGFKELEGEIEWLSLDPRARVKMHNPFQAVQLMARSNVEIYNAQGRAAQTALVTTMSVLFHKVGMGTIKPKETAEYPSSFKINSINQKLDGRELLHLDVFNNVLRVNGIDQLAQWRQHLGV